MSLLVVAAIVIGVSAAAVGLMHAIRRRARSDHFFVEIERGSGIFAFLGTAFAVLLRSSSSRRSRASTTREPAPNPRPRP